MISLSGLPAYANVVIVIAVLCLRIANMSHNLQLLFLMRKSSRTRKAYRITQYQLAIIRCTYQIATDAALSQQLTGFIKLINC